MNYDLHEEPRLQLTWYSAWVTGKGKWEP